MAKARKTSARKTSAKGKSFLITSEGSNKKFYTREDDETIVRMKKAGNTAKEIAKTIGHSEASIRYRTLRVLAFLKNFNEYDYENRRIKLSKDELEKRRKAILKNQNS